MAPRSSPPLPPPTPSPACTTSPIVLPRRLRPVHLHLPPARRAGEGAGTAKTFPFQLDPVPPQRRIRHEAQENTLRKVEEVISRFAKDGVPLLDPQEDMKVQSSSFWKATRRIEALDSLFEKHDIRNSPHIQQKLKVLHAKQEILAKIKVHQENNLVLHCFSLQG